MLEVVEERDGAQGTLTLALGLTETRGNCSNSEEKKDAKFVGGLGVVSFSPGQVKENMKKKTRGKRQRLVHLKNGGTRRVCFGLGFCPQS